MPVFVPHLMESINTAWLAISNHHSGQTTDPIESTEDIINGLPQVRRIQAELTTSFPKRTDQNILARLIFDIHTRPRGTVARYADVQFTSFAWKAEDIQNKLTFLTAEGYVIQSPSGKLEISGEMTTLITQRTQ
jgi:hypothetical protein